MKPVNKTLFITLNILNFLDVITTLIGINNPHIKETNPLFNILGIQLFIILKIITFAFATYFLTIIEKNDKINKVKKIINYSLCVFYAVIIIINITLITIN